MFHWFTYFDYRFTNDIWEISIALKAHIMGLIQGSDCILPQRIDVGKHFIMTGGPEVALLASRDISSYK